MFIMEPSSWRGADSNWPERNRGLDAQRGNRKPSPMVVSKYGRKNLAIPNPQFLAFRESLRFHHFSVYDIAIELSQPVANKCQCNIGRPQATNCADPVRQDRLWIADYLFVCDRIAERVIGMQATCPSVSGRLRTHLFRIKLLYSIKVYGVAIGDDRAIGFDIWFVDDDACHAFSKSCLNRR